MSDSPDPPPADETAGASLLEQFVHREAARLWQGYKNDLGSAVAELARLRRGLPRRGIMPPEAWEIFAEGLPDSLRGRGDAPSYSELAAASALSLFALHQQSRRHQPMHVRGADHGLGRAAHALMLRGESAGVQRRMQALARASALDPVVEQVRGLIGLFRSHEIPLDYAQLASDLRWVQQPQHVHRVRTRWSRDFYRPARPTTESDDSTAGDQA